MVNSFTEMQDNVLAALKGCASDAGVHPDSVSFSTHSPVPPAIQLAVYPVEGPAPVKNPVWFDAVVDVYCYAAGSVNNQESVNNAMEIAYHVFRAVNGLPWILRAKSPSVVAFIDENGRITHPDRCAVVVSFDARYHVGV